MTIIGFIRHGVTPWNELGRMQGQTDIPLNEEGRKQASALAERLAGEEWDVVVSSDLSRARETAEIIAAGIGVGEVHIDPRLRERGFGEAEGIRFQDALEKWGRDFRKLVPGVELDDPLFERIMECVNDLVTIYEGKKLLVVTHGGALRVLLGRMLQNPRDEHIKNTSLSIVAKTDGGWEELLFNCAAHLESIT